MKKEDSLKPYDAKKSVWVPDGEGGFSEALITEVKCYANGIFTFMYTWIKLEIFLLYHTNVQVKGEMIDVKVGWEPKTYKATQCMQINPPKMEKFDDVSNMTYLNEASVLWNLKARYVAKLIYVSNLFPKM